MGITTFKFERRVYSIKYTDDNNQEICLDDEEIELREHLKKLSEEESKDEPI